jgi:magnesium chelatase family protein
MGLARTWSVALHGVVGHLVEIESDVGNGLPGIHLVGLPDAALHEAKDRVKAAVVNSGWSWPNERIVLALSPAMLRKTGSGFDLALACAVLAADGVLPQQALNGAVLLGELALDGRLRPVRGVLPCLLAARAEGVDRVVVPAAALAEASLVDGLEVHGAATLAEVLRWLQGELELRRPGPQPAPVDGEPPPDLADVVGQDDARQACETAAAGGHHMLLLGPPGTGKTMLAQRFVGLLPQLDADAALALASIRSAAGRLPGSGALTTVPPLIAPHHSTSMPALIGGGTGLPRPGAVSLAHGGVLPCGAKAALICVCGYGRFEDVWCSWRLLALARRRSLARSGFTAPGPPRGRAGAEESPGGRVG